MFDLSLEYLYNPSKITTEKANVILCQEIVSWFHLPPPISTYTKSSMHYFNRDQDLLIFHLDDDPEILEHFNSIIEHQLPGAKVRGFLLARDLLDELPKLNRSEHPNLFVLDIKMPDLRGDESHELIEAFYFRCGLRPPPTLFFTGVRPELLGIQRGSLGIWPDGWNVLEKPCTNQKVVEEIKRIVKA